MRKNAVLSSKYDFRHQRLTVSPICPLEDEVDSVVLKSEEYAFPVYQDLSDVASQLEMRKRHLFSPTHSINQSKDKVKV